MPIYVYRCESCSEVHEAFQKLSDAPLSECPSCGATTMRKLIAPAGVIFKGSGFHKNDYGSKGARPASSSSSSPEGPTAPAPAEKKAETGGGSASTESKVA